MTLRIAPAEIVRRSANPLLGIHDTWERVRLGDIADIVNGFAFNSAKFTEGHGTPLIRIRDVGRNGTRTNFVGEFAEKHLVPPGAILVGMDGDFRAARWAGPPALLNQRVCRISVRDNASYAEDFLLYALKGYLDEIHAHTSAVTVKHLSARTIQDIPLPLPPLAEQERIVAAIEKHFSHLDAGTESLEKADKDLKKLRESVLESAVRGQLFLRQPADPSSPTPDDQRFEPSHSELLNSRPSRLASLPFGWRLVPLGDILKGIEAGRSFKTEARKAAPDEWGVIKVSAMTWGSFLEAENKAVREELINPHWEIAPGDLLVSRANTSEYVGASVLVHECRRRLVLSDKSLRLTVKQNIDKRWLWRVLNSPFVRSQLSAVATGTSDSMRNISQPKLRSLVIPIPPKVTQVAIADYLDRHVSIASSVSDALARAMKRGAALRTAVLQRAFLGLLVPQDSNDEPASTLLERIRSTQPDPLPQRRTRTRSQA